VADLPRSLVLPPSVDPRSVGPLPPVVPLGSLAPRLECSARFLDSLRVRGRSDMLKKRKKNNKKKLNQTLKLVTYFDLEGD
jgi:hypothetical protein